MQHPGFRESHLGRTPHGQRALAHAHAVEPRAGDVGDAGVHVHHEAIAAHSSEATSVIRECRAGGNLMPVGLHIWLSKPMQAVRMITPATGA
jgi:hypothetical protein